MDISNRFNTDRTTFLGGSDAAMLMNGETGRLWRRKRGLEPEFDGSNVLPVQMGLWTEPLNRHWFRKKTGFEVLEPQRNDKGELVLQTHPAASFIACNPDGFVVKGPGQTGVFEAKHTGAGKSISDVIDAYYWQLVHNSLVCGMRTVFLSVLFSNSGWDYTEFEVGIDEQVRLLNAELAFWELVQTGVEPANGTPVRRAIDVSVMAEKDMRESNAWMHHARSYIDSRHKAAEFEESKKALKELMPKDVRRAFAGGLEIHRSRDNSLRFKVTDNAS